MPLSRHPLSAPFRASAALAFALIATTASIGYAGDGISVPILGLHSDQGQVGCTLYASKDGFPTNPDKALARQFVKVSGKSATCFFENVPAGSYAISTIHDENGNGKLDKNFVGMPTEGYGASRDARGTMGPPKWEDAVFSHPGGSASVPVTIHY
jgi:uncharacterized protein (DUF2141 family)